MEVQRTEQRNLDRLIEIVRSQFSRLEPLFNSSGFQVTTDEEHIKMDSNDYVQGWSICIYAWAFEQTFEKHLRWRSDDERLLYAEWRGVTMFENRRSEGVTLLFPASGYCIDTASDEEDCAELRHLSTIRAFAADAPYKRHSSRTSCRSSTVALGHGQRTHFETRASLRRSATTRCSSCPTPATLLLTAD